MKLLAGVSALVAIAIAVSASVGGPRANAARASGAVTWPPTLASSRVIARGRLVCTAAVKAQVQAGHAVTVGFTLHNRSRRAVQVPLWVFTTSYVLHAADGTSYDTRAPYESFPGIPPPFPKKVRPGATLHLRPTGVTVRWGGRLLITPRCLGTTLHRLPVQVTGPWPAPSPSIAIGEVVAVAGHLFDHCLPQTPGVPVDGQIYPPSGNAPPMDARCSISVGSEGTFLVAQALVLIPPGLSGVQIYDPYETLWPIGNAFGGPAISPPYEAIAWEFVVTRERATPVAAATVVATSSSSKTAPLFSWNGTKWEQGGDSCGGRSFSWGGTSPDIEFISACSG
jgi:hypothetical protein